MNTFSGMDSLIRDYIAFKDCDRKTQFSFANLLLFPEELTALSWSVLFDNNDVIAEVLMTNTGFIIGGYSIQPDQTNNTIHVHKIVVNPQLKSTKYFSDLIEHICQRGHELFFDNFKGITTFYIKRDNGSLKEEYLMKSFAKVGGIVVFEDKISKNKFLCFSVIPLNGGLTQNELHEIYSNFVPKE